MGTTDRAEASIPQDMSELSTSLLHAPNYSFKNAQFIAKSTFKTQFLFMPNDVRGPGSGGVRGGQEAAEGPQATL